jgi:hypothetical protein
MKALKLTSDKLLSFFFLLFGIFYLVSCKGLTLGSFGSPGEALVPVITGSFITLFSLILLLRKDKIAKETMDRDTIVRIIKITAAVFIYVILMTLVGFKISTLVTTMAAVRILGHDNWKTNLLFSVLSMVCAALIFQVWLALPLPEPLLQYFGL